MAIAPLTTPDLVIQDAPIPQALGAPHMLPDPTRPLRHLVWFRRDLRIHDNPALLEASIHQAHVVGLVVLPAPDDPSWGQAARAWLHHSLQVLQVNMEQLGSRLVVVRQDPQATTAQTVARLARHWQAQAIFVNRANTPPDVQAEHACAQAAAHDNIKVVCCGSPWLVEPHNLRSNAGTPWKVFTHFARQLRQLWQPCQPLPAPSVHPTPTVEWWPDDVPMNQWNLLPSHPWAQAMMSHWQAGEDAALLRLQDFFLQDIAGYHAARQRPDQDKTSRLSPHLAFGEVSVHTVLHHHDLAKNTGQAPAVDIDSFWNGIAWREFARYLWHEDPDFPHKDWRPTPTPWVATPARHHRAWRKGRTGLPMVDAAMRQLWSTGWMHNRSRMIVADFWCKHLGHDWKEGAAWFLDTLVDADVASNALGWQWASGTGPDAAPYYRVFNPVTQGQRFDPDGTYRHAHLPELAALTGKALDTPWEHGGAPGYPAQPLCTPAQGRARALGHHRRP